MTDNFTYKYIDYGIASRISNNTILVNKNLKKLEYLPLYVEILEHERNHTDSFSKRDILLDIKGFKHKKLYWKFLFSNPKALTELFPLIRYQGQWYFNPTTFLYWLAILIWGGLILWALI